MNCQLLVRVYTNSKYGEERDNLKFSCCKAKGVVDVALLEFVAELQKIIGLIQFFKLPNGRV